MIELVQFLPPGCCVARRATDNRTVLTFRPHSFLKLTFVWIDMAGRAGDIFKMVFQWLLSSGNHWFVTIRAQHRRVRAGQRKARLFVSRQREVRSWKSLHVMTRFAAI